MIPLPSLASLHTAPMGTDLIDSYGRIHTSCRISLTDKCNLRCTYCMDENATFVNQSQILTSQELGVLARVLVESGITKIRLTGGEPLLRKDIVEVTRDLSSLKGLTDLALTTNGLLLSDLASDLRAAGLDRLNISLDTLDPTQFKTLSRRNGLQYVLAGIDSAINAKFGSIKLNAVILKDINADQVVPLATYAIERGLEMRYIESMPIGAQDWDKSAMVSADEIHSILEAKLGPLEPEPRTDEASPAETWKVKNGGRIGIIASVTKPFCSQCNRLRLTADGYLRACLFSTDETDLKGFLRPKLDQTSLVQAIRNTVWNKGPGHGITSNSFVKPTRTMHSIGG